MEIEELRAEVRRGEQRLRTANRDMKSMQDKAELHSKFSTQYLAELEALRAQRQSPDKRRASAPSSNGNADAPPQAAGEAGDLRCRLIDCLGLWWRSRGNVQSSENSN